MKKTYIAVIGKTCAGKETLCNLFREEMKDKKIVSYRFSDPLNEILDVLHYHGLVNKVFDILYVMGISYRPNYLAIVLDILGLEKKFRNKLMLFITLNDFFSDTICQEGRYPRNRPNQQFLSTKLREAFGEEVLGNALQKRAETDNADFIFFDGVRRPQDVVMLRRLSESLIINLVADMNVRFERLRKRADRPGDAEKTWEEFQSEQAAESESRIDEIARYADVHIDNSHDNPEKFRSEVKKLLQEKVYLV